MALIVLAIIGALITLAASVAGLLVSAESEMREKTESGVEAKS